MASKDDRDEATALQEAVDRLADLWDSKIVPALEVAFEPESVIERAQAAFADIRVAAEAVA
jgi:hypothetical protein